MNLSKIIQKIEGYDWESERDFEVVSCEQTPDGAVVRFKAVMDCTDVLRSFLNRLYAYKSDKTMLVVTSFGSVCAVKDNAEWRVNLVEKENPDYEEKKEEAE